MKLENQCVSLELAKRLKSLNVRQESEFYWVEFKSFPVKPWQIATKDEVESFNHPELAISAFLSSEIGEMLPTYIEWGVSDGVRTKLLLPFVVKKMQLWAVSYQDLSAKSEFKIYGHEEYAETECDARAKMLIYLIENNLIEVKSL